MKLNLFFNKFSMLLAVLLIFSCSSSDGGDDGGNSGTPSNLPETSISISTGYDKVFKDTGVVFWVTNNNDENVTSNSTIYVDGTAIASNNHTFTATGTYTIYATKDGLQTQDITIEVIVPTHTTKVMVEDYTGTWCGYCPRLATALENTVNLNSDVIPVAVHDDNDMLFPYAVQMENAFGITGFPTGKVNRTINWNESTSQPISYLDVKQKMGLAINSSLSGNTITAEVKVHYDIDENNEQRLVVYLLENGLVYPQVNYYNNDPSSPWYQSGDPITNFVHDHVAREVFTDVFGDVIPSSQTKADNTYTATLTMTVPSSVQDTDELEIVAFVTGSDKKVQNVQKANLGENKDFD